MSKVDRPTFVFVGGTGRSGTTIVAQMLGHLNGLTYTPSEMRFHVDSVGLMDLAFGEVEAEQFKDRMLGEFFRRTTPMGERGLASHIEFDRLEELIVSKIKRVDEHPTEVSHEIFADSMKAMFGGHAWIEMTPANVLRWDDLSRVFPDSCLIHVVRDGRDVAASVVRMRWGPDDMIMALHWWASRLRKADAVRRVATIEPLYVPFEQFASAETRDHWIEIMLDYVGRERTDALERFVKETLSEKRAHLGRWSAEVPPDQVDRIDELYRTLWHDLDDVGVLGLPALDEAPR